MRKAKQQKIGGKQDKISVVVPELIGEKIRKKAAERGESISRYAAMLIKKAIETEEENTASSKKIEKQAEKPA